MRLFLRAMFNGIVGGVCGIMGAFAIGLALAFAGWHSTLTRVLTGTTMVVCAGAAVSWLTILQRRTLRLEVFELVVQALLALIPAFLMLGLVDF